MAASLHLSRVFEARFEVKGRQAYVLEVVEEVGDSFPLGFSQHIIVVNLGAA